MNLRRPLYVVCVAALVVVLLASHDLVVGVRNIMTNQPVDTGWWLSYGR